MRFFSVDKAYVTDENTATSDYARTHAAHKADRQSIEGRVLIDRASTLRRHASHLVDWHSA